LFKAEYERGRDDALARIIAAAQHGAVPKRGNGGGAPTQDLIDSELKRAGKSLSAREIFDSEANVGGAVGLDAIEQALRRGRKQERYLVQGGRWSLAPACRT